MSAAHLERLQHWMQSVVVHPDGVVAGARGAAAAGGLDAEVPDVVAPSATLSAEARVGLYAGMYLERLAGVLEEDFPAVREVVGASAFRDLAAGYVAAYPPSHYSLNELGARFADFLQEEGPELPEPRRFVVELARLERAVQEVFDAPAAPPLAADALETVPQEAFATARLRPVPALRLFAFEHPTNAWYQAFREGRNCPEPRPGPSWLAVYRRAHRVWRLELDAVQHALLRALAGGAPLAEALEAAASLPEAEPAELAAALGGWFRDWTGLGFFAAIEADLAWGSEDVSAGPAAGSGRFD